MKKLTVREIGEYGLCILRDEANNQKYEFVLDFHKLEDPKVGDILVMSNDYIFNTSEFFSSMYSFEPTDEITVKAFLDNPNKAYILYSSNGKNYVLRRIYG